MLEGWKVYILSEIVYKKNSWNNYLVVRNEKTEKTIANTPLFCILKPL